MENIEGVVIVRDGIHIVYASGLIDIEAWYDPQATRDWQRWLERSRLNGVASLFDFLKARQIIEFFRRSHPEEVKVCVAAFIASGRNACTKNCRMPGACPWLWRTSWKVDHGTDSRYRRKRLPFHASRESRGGRRYGAGIDAAGRGRRWEVLTKKSYFSPSITKGGKKIARRSSILHRYLRKYYPTNARNEATLDQISTFSSGPEIL